MKRVLTPFEQAISSLVFGRTIYTREDLESYLEQIDLLSELREVELSPEQITHDRKSAESSGDF